MVEYWERSAVIGTGGDGESSYMEKEVVLHKRGEDPIVLACRRNNRLAKSHRIQVETDQAFIQARDEEPRRNKNDILVSGARGEEWDW